MSKLVKSLLLTTLVSTAASASTDPVVVPSAPAIAAKSYILMDYYTGQTLVEQNADERLPPASLTKMMTSYIVGQELAKGNIKREDMVTISQNAWSKNYSDSSKMFIEVGKQVSVDDLNKGIIIQSGNDACVAMAEHIAGSTDSFASLMNTWAAKLGMTNSHFMNPHGLHEAEHYSTARDMALLGQALVRDVPEEYKIYSQKSFQFNGITQHNRNKLLWDASLNVDGIKTGHVSEIGYNLVASATNKEGMRLISVVMGTASERVRAEESKKLLTYGFRFFQTLTPYKAGTELVTQKIWMGDKSTVKLGVDKDVAVTITRGQSDKLKADFQLDSELKAPLSKGQRVGTVFLKLGDKEIAQVPLVALEEVQEGNLLSRIWDYLMMLVQSLFK
ncbi:D-alanyl-D-alanine carboxypeptidase family protein [Aeromonas schubertii]|uniref:serine-type D-Ala-D-Ala carboxypeptidase n=1 Tax=Aeromonas schubertii TaxID=652 RepID=A0A0S2SEV7_9GAMM|nr:D-alanyl-D-alanine carboxypeptidase family protein [Aeromonas schubertii]ALP40238.1 penicillin-binding protein [Aeromonas schubertii]KUE79487.1 D-alanyl-D-alanine carboxypeptidase [Aeromonas schubertii]MBZ6065489.1 D-alanyl-D-alanine carboxypeptidase [Aeromonas schubertii]MBZ6072253.1 D-alanyl-D-alanine carboxypeptidase [Aeromonas schubertii]QCG49158.1 D-alanyl-D-alanine carboxypeptidase [Aeromonas schubertii]